MPKIRMLDINLRSVLASTSIGSGPSALRTFCTQMNFPQPVSEHPYNKYLLHIKNVSLKNAEESISSAAKQLRKVIGELDDDDDSILNVAVSVDGSWQKRYGFNSLPGVIFIISIDTGCVLDFSIKSLICHVCKKNKEVTETWEKIHEATCLVNHEGSSGSMEKEGAIEMFLGSVEKHELRYTKYVGDGDAGSFGAVKEAVTEKYGEHYPLQKEDCIGHVQKRMGAALISFKNKKRGSVLSDGKGFGGSGRLTNVIIDKIQTWICNSKKQGEYWENPGSDMGNISSYAKRS